MWQHGFWTSEFSNYPISCIFFSVNDVILLWLNCFIFKIEWGLVVTPASQGYSEIQPWPTVNVLFLCDIGGWLHRAPVSSWSQTISDCWVWGLIVCWVVKELTSDSDLCLCNMDLMMLTPLKNWHPWRTEIQLIHYIVQMKKTTAFLTYGLDTDVCQCFCGIACYLLVCCAELVNRTQEEGHTMHNETLAPIGVWLGPVELNFATALKICANCTWVRILLG